MSGGRTTILRDKLRNLGLAGHAILVGAVIGLAWLAAAPVAYALSGPQGPWAAAVAAVVCLSGALVAVATTSLVRGPGAAMHSLVLGMLARALLPLLIGVVLVIKVRWLAETGMIVYLLLFYLATLVVETAVAICQLSNTAKS